MLAAEKLRNLSKAASASNIRKLLATCRNQTISANSLIPRFLRRKKKKVFTTSIFGGLRILGNFEEVQGILAFAEKNEKREKKERKREKSFYYVKAKKERRKKKLFHVEQFEVKS